jgi:hypothetical protein
MTAKTRIYAIGWAGEKNSPLPKFIFNVRYEFPKPDVPETNYCGASGLTWTCQGRVSMAHFTDTTADIIGTVKTLDGMQYTFHYQSDGEASGLDIRDKNGDPLYTTGTDDKGQLVKYGLQRGSIAVT